jgi:hypothetical protein
MFKIVRTYKERMPSMRLIGIPYYNKDRNEFSFSDKWDEWFVSNRFEALEELFPLFDDYIGCMRINNGEFEYWIGMFFPIDTPAPEGFQYADIDEGYVGTNWIYGSKESGELFTADALEACVKRLKEFNWTPADTWFFERYNCPRFTHPDENGNVILDYSIYLKD